MAEQYSPDKQLIKDFIRYISDNHRAGVVEFPDEFAAHQYVNYRFVNVSELIEEFIKEREVCTKHLNNQSIEDQLKEIRKELEESLAKYRDSGYLIKRKGK